MADESNNLSNLSAEEKRALLTKLLLERAGESASSHPLSYGQKALWFLYQLAPQSAAYNIMYAARIRGTLDISALEGAAQALLDRHATLRTTYATRDGQPVQLIHPRRHVDFKVREAAAWGDEHLNEWLREEANRPFDLQTGPVLRVNLLLRSAAEQILLLTFHHIAVDFWSLDILLDELCMLYSAREGEQPPSPARQYVDHVSLEAQMLQSAEGEALWSYWREQLGGQLPTLNLPATRGRLSAQTYRGAVQHFTLERALTRRLKELAREEGVTLYVLLLAAFFTLLHRYSGQDDILVGTPTANRNRAGFEGVVGYFVNQVVLRPGLAGNPTFRSFLGRVRTTVLDALAHQDYPFSLLVERLQPARDLSHSPICQVSFVWEQPRRFREEAATARSEADAPKGRAGLRPETIAVGQGGAPIELMLLISEREETLSAALQYNTDLFDADTIARMVRHLETLLAGIVTNPCERLRELPLLSDAERRQFVEWNATTLERRSNRCLHQLVEAQAERTPHAVAISFREQELTYWELNRRANRLARRLRVMGVGPETVVGVCLERSLEAVVSLLGILKAGGAFLPLDPSYPRERLANILEDAQAPVCLTQQRILERLSHAGCRLVCLDTEEEAGALENADDDNACLTDPGNLAYVIYTSGSTGRPKGVLITHHAICNRLLWMQEEYQLNEADGVLQKTPMSFDVSVWEFFWPLMVGARLVMAEPEGHKDSAYLVRTIVEQGITTIHFVPSMLRVFLSDPGAAACRSLRRVFCSGEALPFDLQERFLAGLGAELHNLYGPTEAAIDVTSYSCRREARAPLVPIGRPIANTQIHLLDASLRRVPVGVAGELFIGGDGVARGYLNRPELTASQFLPDPFSGRPGARLYRTGDLARYLPDGEIEYLGRIDHQVKIRGVRIELDEVEAALQQHPSVQESVVIDAEDGERGKRLVAYFVAATGATPTTSELRRFMLEKLPEAMVPSIFVPLAALPLTSSGKIDRRALPAPDTTRPSLEEAFVAPRNRSEEMLAAIWRQVLNLERVGVHDNFFTLGGASTQSLEVAARANALGLALTPESIFRYGTIAELAAAYGTEPATVQDGRPEATDEVPTPLPSTASPPTAFTPQGAKGNTVIESLGIYLPPKVMSTEEVLRGCENRVLMPLERLTGIKTRRVAGDEEFSIDLAQRAVADCLAKSSFAPEEIDLLVCCNISRYDGPGHRFTFEPSTSVRLRKHFGLDRALVFDIANACAGMFTGIAIVDAFLKAGLIRCGMVVSGEYLTNLISTAQKEIEDFMDKRLACLTVGDAGAALILKRAPDCEVGFHELDMYTLSRYSSLCIAKATDKPHGGAIMLTDSIAQTALAVKHTVSHAAFVMQRGGWSPEAFQHLIMHQTSESSLKDGIIAINRLFKKEVAHTGNTIYNLAERGNTASTTHFVAIADHIRNNRIQSGDRVLFSITGSGQTIGVALYTFDDLPDRLRQASTNGHRRHSSASRPPAARPEPPPPPRVRIESVGTAPAAPSEARSSVELAVQAAAACLEGSSLNSGDLGLLIHAGVYRDEFMSEPAIASLVAGQLKINDDVQSSDERKTFAFDVLNGGLGFLNACHIAIQMIAADRYMNAMIIASEIENNRRAGAKRLRGIKEAGSAVILSRPKHGAAGFGRFVFKYQTELSDAFASYTRHEAGKTYLEFESDLRINDYYLESIPEAVDELLALEGLTPSMVKLVFPPQISPDFLSRLAVKMGLPRDRFVDVAFEGEDYFTSSLPFGWQQAQTQKLVRPGDIALLIGVGSGIQVGCATYYF